MTREEVEYTIGQAKETASEWVTGKLNDLDDHDAEQRQIIDEQDKEIERLQGGCWDRLIQYLDWLTQHTASSGPDDRTASAAVAIYRSLQEWARKQKALTCPR